MAYRPAWLSVPCVLVLLGACGGKVAVDLGASTTGGGGAGGATTTGTFTTTTTSTGTFPGTCGGSVFSSSPPCQSCAQTSCCAELTACAVGTTCGNLLECRSSCSTDACVAGCQEKFGDFPPELTALTLCFQDNCPQACHWPICDSGADSANQACAACAASSCCPQFEACTSDDICASCIFGEPEGPSCASSPLVTSLLGCLKMSCTLSCPQL